MFEYIDLEANNRLYKKGSDSSYIKTKSLSTFKPEPSIKENKKLNRFLITSFIISFFILGFITISLTKSFTNYSNNISTLTKERKVLKDKQAFNFLLNSGKGYLKRNNIINAYSEFILAYKVNPNNKELNQLLIETLNILCIDNNKYCNELDNFLNTNSFANYDC